MAKDRNLDSSMGWGRVLSPGNFQNNWNKIINSTKYIFTLSHHSSKSTSLRFQYLLPTLTVLIYFFWTFTNLSVLHKEAYFIKHIWNLLFIIMFSCHTLMSGIVVWGAYPVIKAHHLLGFVSPLLCWEGKVSARIWVWFGSWRYESGELELDVIIKSFKIS